MNNRTNTPEELLAAQRGAMNTMHGPQVNGVIPTLTADEWWAKHNRQTRPAQEKAQGTKTMSDYGDDAKTKADAIQIDGTHYKDMAMQPWDVMQAVMTHEEFVGFLKGNIIKYAMRDGRKPGAEADAKKALHYKQKLAEVKA